ncbi:MAG: hypothetical protein GXY41_12130 [Phycisphaerae bacterium]|nr:hypothetical protein [Phycisphaerae bacterium]
MDNRDKRAPDIDKRSLRFRLDSDITMIAGVTRLKQGDTSICKFIVID